MNKVFIKNAYEQIVANIGDKVILLAVSKYQSLDKIKYLSELGQKDFGENYLQELELKAKESPELNWHFIGALQSRKIKKIVELASTIHSVEKKEHLIKINTAAQYQNKKIDVYLQINIDDDPYKSGFGSMQMDDAIECIVLASDFTHVNVIGLMCLPTKSVEPKQSFIKMQQFYDTVNSKLDTSQKLTELSMGMSGDYQEAIECGSTIVRIGSSLFGDRGKCLKLSLS